MSARNFLYKMMEILLNREDMDMVLNAEDISGLDREGIIYEMDRNIQEKFASQFTTLLANPCTNDANKLKRDAILQSLVANAHERLQVSNLDIHLDAAEDIFKNEDDVTCFASDARRNLAEVIPSSFSEEVLAFHRRRNKSQKDRTKKLEMIRQFEIENVKTVDPCAGKSLSKYETSETLIRNLLEGIEENKIEKLVSDETKQTLEYRMKQVRFGRALLDVGSKHIVMVKDILRRYKRYNKLTPYEIAFIHHLYFETGVLIYTNKPQTLDHLKAHMLHVIADIQP